MLKAKLMLVILSTLTLIAVATIHASQNNDAPQMETIALALPIQNMIRYRQKYYQIACFKNGRVNYSDWGETDLSHYRDGRLEYFSAMKNEIVTFYFDSMVCVSVPPRGPMI